MQDPEEATWKPLFPSQSSTTAVHEEGSTGNSVSHQQNIEDSTEASNQSSIQQSQSKTQSEQSEDDSEDGLPPASLPPASLPQTTSPTKVVVELDDNNEGDPEALPPVASTQPKFSVGLGLGKEDTPIAPTMCPVGADVQAVAAHIESLRAVLGRETILSLEELQMLDDMGLRKVCFHEVPQVRTFERNPLEWEGLEEVAPPTESRLSAEEEAKEREEIAASGMVRAFGLKRRKRPGIIFAEHQQQEQQAPHNNGPHSPPPPSESDDASTTASVAESDDVSSSGSVVSKGEAMNVDEEEEDETLASGLAAAVRSRSPNQMQRQAWQE